MSSAIPLVIFFCVVIFVWVVSHAYLILMQLGVTRYIWYHISVELGLIPRASTCALDEIEPFAAHPSVDAIIELARQARQNGQMTFDFVFSPPLPAHAPPHIMRAINRKVAALGRYRLEPATPFYAAEPVERVRLNIAKPASSLAWKNARGPLCAALAVSLLFNAVWVIRR